MTASTQSRVLLENVEVRQSGTYLCEVTVTPGYYALMQFANMTVVGKFHISSTIILNLTNFLFQHTLLVTVKIA
jgi:hypothetical protein